jgi:hypothetical protein
MMVADENDIEAHYDVDDTCGHRHHHPNCR